MICIKNRMNKWASCHKALPIAILLALLLCDNSRTSFAQSGGGGGLSASLSGSISGPNGGGAQLNADANLSGSGSSAGAQLSSGLGGGSGASMSSSSGGGESSGGQSSQASGGGGSLSAQFGQSTPKPEGFITKVKEIVKSSVESITKDDKQSGGGSSTSGGGGANNESSGKSEGIMDKIGDAAKRGKEMVKEKASEFSEGVKSIMKPDEHSGSGGLSASGNLKIGGTSAEGKVQIGGSGSSSSGSNGSSGSSGGGGGTLSKLVNKGTEMMQKVEDKAMQFGEKITKPLNEKAKSKESGGQPKESGVGVEMFDKMHELSRKPAEQLLRPIDKVLGVEKDPLIKAYDDGHQLLRKPVGMVAKPVESMLSGAFKTTDEAKAEQDRFLSEQDRREIRMREERAKKEGRSVLGMITDRTVELAEKPFEIILKPFDRVLGLDKDGKKSPLIQLIDQIYGLSKKPIDAVAKPFEKVLKKMADGEQPYQVSLRFQSSESGAADPKLFTRLADGALNIADRVVTAPIGFAMRPLGFDRKKNPIVNAAHSLKNATKVGVELFTKPIDRIIKEIAEIGAIKDESEREAQIERKRQEASRIVAALDKINEIAQAPFEIVLRPVGRALGFTKEGQKDSFLRAWDVLYQVYKTPIQVISKPVEDAILGERKHQKGAKNVNKATATIAKSAYQNEKKKNFFVEQIKKVEKFATKPLEILTSPIRRLILGEEANSGGKGFQVKGQLGPIKAQANLKTGGNNGKKQDKIVKAIEQLNNVVLKPIEVMTQPISDTLTTDDGKLKNKVEIKTKGQENRGGSSTSSGSVGLSASGSAQLGSSSISGSAQIKKN